MSLYKSLLSTLLLSLTFSCQSVLTKVEPQAVGVSPTKLKKVNEVVDDLIAKRKILVGIQKQQILDSIANLKLQKQELEVDAKKLTIWERISQAFVKTKDQASEITEEEKKIAEKRKEKKNIVSS